jgi:type I restriction enzyme S subunit
MALGLTPHQIIEKGIHPQLVIADEWERVELKKIASVQNGYAFSSKLFNRTEGMPLIRIRDIFSVETENLYLGEYKEDFVVNKGDILIGMDGDFKVSKWPGNKGLLNQRVCRIHFDSNHYDKEFLFICIQPYLNAIHSETSAVTVKHLSSRTINDIPFPLPPLPEQRAIVAKIEELFSDLDKGIADLKKAQDQLKVYRQAVLKKAFEGELTKDWREQQTDLTPADALLKQIKEERQKHYEQKLENYKQAIKTWEKNDKEEKKPGKPKIMKALPALTKDELESLPVLNKYWKWSTIDNIAGHDASSLKAGPFGSSLKKSFYTETGYKIYGQEQVISGDSTYGNYYVNEEKFQSLINCAIAPFDILISLVGTVGKVLVLPEDCEKGIINPRLVKVTLNSFYESVFFKYYFESSFLKSLYKLKNHGTTMDVLNLGSIKELPYPICSKEEQLQIVQEIESRLSVCDNVELSIVESLEKAKALRQSILKKAFDGTLLSVAEIAACKAAKDYEPASVLLKKIKAEKKI